MADEAKKEAAKPAARGQGGGLADFFNKLSKREKMIAYGAGFVFLVLLLDKVILNPIINNIESLEYQTQEEISMIKDDLLIIGYEDRINQEFDQLKVYFVEMRKTVSEERAEFLREMETLAQGAGVHLVTINPVDEIEEGKLYTEYRIKLQCLGTMDKVLSYIYSLSTSQLPTKVETLEILPPGKGKEEATCAMTVSRIYVTK